MWTTTVTIANTLLASTRVALHNRPNPPLTDGEWVELVFTGRRVHPDIRLRCLSRQFGSR
jgi:hypothetical protein